MRKILIQISIFSTMFILIFTLNRYLMQIDFIPSELLNNEKYPLLKMYLLGIFHDIRLLSVAFLPLFVAGLILQFIPNAHKEKIEKIYLVLSSFYISVIAILCVIFAYIKYYYYEIYKSKIDIFMFSLKDDNIQTILNIIYEDYPILKILFLSFILILVCIVINIKISKLKFKKLHLNKGSYIFLNLLLIFFYIIALRGPFKHVAINVQNYSFSSHSVLNDTMLNPIMAFSWAYKQFKNEAQFKIISEEEALNIQKKLFPYEYKSPKNIKAETINPSVFINLMESFGLNMQEFSEENFNLLGALKQHFEEDFVFTRFLSSSNGTIPSFANLFFISPFSNISTSKFQKHNLKLSPINIYKNAGYKVIFISAGNGSWQNIKNYLTTLGVDEIIDENTIMQEYKEAKNTENGYGIADEFLYKKVYQLLQDNPTKTLIIGLTISNHPPYKFPEENLPPLKNPSQNLLELLPYKKEKQHNIIYAYLYANDAFGKFLNQIKQSNLKDKVIIAASGDHRVREMSMNLNTDKAFAYSVPFYIYIPKILQNDIYYDKNRVGSHKDIFPTLYALSLSNVKYISVGGRNMLSKIENKKLEFGFNDAIWIDKDGIYPLEGNKAYHYKTNHSLKDTNQFFEMDEYHKNFYKLYQDLNFYQLSKRMYLK